MSSVLSVAAISFTCPPTFRTIVYLIDERPVGSFATNIMRGVDAVVSRGRYFQPSVCAGRSRRGASLQLQLGRTSFSRRLRRSAIEIEILLTSWLAHASSSSSLMRSPSSCATLRSRPSFRGAIDGPLLEARDACRALAAGWVCRCIFSCAPSEVDLLLQKNATELFQRRDLRSHMISCGYGEKSAPAGSAPPPLDRGCRCSSTGIGISAVSVIRLQGALFVRAARASHCRRR